MGGVTWRTAVVLVEFAYQWGMKMNGTPPGLHVFDDDSRPSADLMRCGLRRAGTTSSAGIAATGVTDFGRQLMRLQRRRRATANGRYSPCGANLRRGRSRSCDAALGMKRMFYHIGMAGLEWVERAASAQIARQLESGGIIDSKAGILFAYCGALLVGAPTLAKQTNALPMWLTMVIAMTSAAMCAATLWPIHYEDAPDPQKLLDHVRGGVHTPVELLEALVDQEMDDLCTNTSQLDEKIKRFKVSIVLSAVATLMLAWAAAF
jgi:hypothetical protein